MTYHITSPGYIGSQAIADTSTVQNHPLGTRVNAYDPTYGEGKFIYCVGVASTVVGDCVLIKPNGFTTIRSVANGIGPVGFAMSANVASQYGWYQIYGAARGQVATVASLASLFLSSAGVLDDASVTGDRVWNAKVTAVTTSATVQTIEIAHPFVQDGQAV
jgi:hypothetical protein